MANHSFPLHHDQFTQQPVNYCHEVYGAPPSEPFQPNIYFSEFPNANPNEPMCISQSVLQSALALETSVYGEPEHSLDEINAHPNALPPCQIPLPPPPPCPLDHESIQKDHHHRLRVEPTYQTRFSELGPTLGPAATAPQSNGPGLISSAGTSKRGRRGKRRGMAVRLAMPRERERARSNYPGV